MKKKNGSPTQNPARRKSRLLILAVLLLLAAGLSCDQYAEAPEGDGEANQEIQGQLERLQAHVEGLEATMARNTVLGVAATAVTFPDRIDCGYEETYSEAGTYTITNNCEFSAYVQKYDANGNYVDQEKIVGGDSSSTTIAGGESIKVICTLVETVANHRCVVTKQ